VGGGDVEGAGAKGVREMDAELGATGGEVDDLAEGGVAEVVGWQGVLGFGDLLGGCPGDDPDGVGLGVEGCREGEQGQEQEVLGARVQGSLLEGD